MNKIKNPPGVKMNNIIFKSKKIKPLNIVIWKPSTTHNENVYDNYIKKIIKNILNVKELQAKTFQRAVNFSIDDRLIYIPDIKNSRTDVKQYFDTKWFEKEDSKIDPTYFIMDVFYYKGFIIIRNVFQPQFTNKAAMQINQLIAGGLSHFGSAYNLVFDRNKNYEQIELIEQNIIKQTKISTVGGQKPLDWFYSATDINFGSLQMEMDKAVEINKAPYDLKEFNKQLAVFESIPDMRINLDKDEINDTIENEQAGDIYKLKALIAATENLLKENMIYDLTSHYFKINEHQQLGVKNV